MEPLIKMVSENVFLFVICLFYRYGHCERVVLASSAEVRESFQQVPMQLLDWLVRFPGVFRGLQELGFEYIFIEFCVVYVLWRQLINFVLIGFVNECTGGDCSDWRAVWRQFNVRDTWTLTSWPLPALYVENEAWWDMTFFSLSFRLYTYQTYNGYL